MVMLATVDGKTTEGDNTNIYTWTSLEDQKYFFPLINSYSVIVMGGKTYEAVRSILKLKENKLRIVLTRHPKKYSLQTIKGQLEFSNEEPKQLVRRLSMIGYKKILLVGGSIINGLFLKDNLIDELYLTVEPKIFGKGKNIVEGQSLNKSLRLINIEKLNKEGTLLLKYKIKK